ncbi:hypothetical protein ASG49_00390 [Marmoricola sp. Leaf446]|uniref:AMP-binding protein n=1 Tax=Marmoricola sp. Leaf446 TaxID=1736379 RepID=UPI0006FDDBB2|nr:AMP-binding protein [Marmoricola sp. Leaf446]KQT93515.1 hypothetical protein ASG49_00390 [Marmoricola sp. Leaf446]
MGETSYAPGSDDLDLGLGDTLFESLQRAAASVEPGRRALVGIRDAAEWVELDYAALVSTVVDASSYLAGLGLGAGDVLCVQLPNWTEAVVYTYAAARLGAVVCPITTIYRERELAFILERTECKVLVVPARYRRFDYASMASRLRDRLPLLRHVIVVGDSERAAGTLPSSEVLAGSRDTVPAAAVDPDAPAVLAFTSGTTGESKGVVHSHASMHAAIDDLVSHAEYGAGLTSLVISPFGHLTGFTWGILMPLRGAGDVVLLETWDAERALDLVERYDVSFAMGATPFLSDLLDAAASRPEPVFPGIFVCGGAPIPPGLVQRAVREHRSRVVAVWGMSEYPVGTATTVSDDPGLASSSDGRPIRRAKVLVVDPSGTRAATGEEGDLLIRGPGLFRGYYKRPDLDAESLTSEGFLRTGDRARVLDDQGNIRICGRTKDIIIRGGENIPVVEIENLLLTHPAIREVALVPVPHERLGETACACIVPSPGSEVPSVAELGTFLGEHGVATQFFPEAVRLREELPRTPSGKIQKFVLRDQVLGHTDDAGRDPATRL